MTYRNNYELTTPTIPAWRRFGLWLNPQRWRLARKARGGHWVCYFRYANVFGSLLGWEWVQSDACTSQKLTTEAHGPRYDADQNKWLVAKCEDHGEVWG